MLFLNKVKHEIFALINFRHKVNLIFAFVRKLLFADIAEKIGRSGNPGVLIWRRR
jgi:hypothetical protein